MLFTYGAKSIATARRYATSITHRFTMMLTHFKGEARRPSDKGTAQHSAAEWPSPGLTRAHNHRCCWGSCMCPLGNPAQLEGNRSTHCELLVMVWQYAIP